MKCTRAYEPRAYATSQRLCDAVKLTTSSRTVVGDVEDERIVVEARVFERLRDRGHGAVDLQRRQRLSRSAFGEELLGSRPVLRSTFLACALCSLGSVRVFHKVSSITTAASCIKRFAW